MKVQGMKWLGLSVLLATGFLLVAPPAFAASGSGYSATCKDGTSWTGTSKRGACRGHKGVKSWTGEGASSAATESGSAATHERKSRSSKQPEEAASPGAAAPAAAAGELTATCKDGQLVVWQVQARRLPRAQGRRQLARCHGGRCTGRSSAREKYACQPDGHAAFG